MAETIKAGNWIIGLSIYFFGFFFIVYAAVNAGSAAYLDVSNIDNPDSGFMTATHALENHTIGDDPVNASTTVSWTNIKSSLSIMTGFGSGRGFGFPGYLVFMFSFIFFWIPSLMLAWAIYSAIPFIH